MKAEQNKKKGSGPKKAYSLNGKRLGMRGVMATALLESGISNRKACQISGISQTAGLFLKRNRVMSREHVEALKSHLQAKFARIAAEALDAIDKEKFGKAGFGELVRGAALAAQNAGITSPNVQEYYRQIFMAKYAIQVDKVQTADPDRIEGLTTNE